MVRCRRSTRLLLMAGLLVVLGGLALLLRPSPDPAPGTDALAASPTTLGLPNPAGSGPNVCVFHQNSDRIKSFLIVCPHRAGDDVKNILVRRANPQKRLSGNDGRAHIKRRALSGGHPVLVD